ncbi:MAG: glycosyltransferase family 4 protein [Acidimicrobiales bacterium]
MQRGLLDHRRDRGVLKRGRSLSSGVAAAAAPGIPADPGTPPDALSILMVSARFAPFVGGTEIHTGEVAAELAARGHEVTVLTTETSGSLPESERIGDVTLLRVPAYPRRTDLYIAPRIRDVIADGRWDIVHVQGYHTAVAPIALAAAQRAEIPTVLTFHSGGHSSSFRNLIRPIQVLALRRYLLRCEAMIAVSQFEAELFASRLRIGIDRIKVIPNGVSTSRPNLVPDTLQPAGPSAPPTPSVEVDGEPTGAPTILSMGRLVRYKGHHRVIKAMPHILKSNPDARLLILGRGPYERRLRRLAVRIGVADRVDFDYVPSGERDRLQTIMGNASMAVLLSAYESQGLAAHEAISAGLPLVVMDKTALSELVSAGHAQAIPPHATHREVAAIVNRSLRLECAAGDRERGRAPATLTWPTIVDRILAEYRVASSNSRRGGNSL